MKGVFARQVDPVLSTYWVEANRAVVKGCPLPVMHAAQAFSQVYFFVTVAASFTVRERGITQVSLVVCLGQCLGHVCIRLAETSARIHFF